MINSSWGIIYYNFMAPSFIVTTLDTTYNTPRKILTKIEIIKDSKLWIDINDWLIFTMKELLDKILMQ